MYKLVTCYKEPLHFYLCRRSEPPFSGSNPHVLLRSSNFANGIGGRGKKRTSPRTATANGRISRPFQPRSLMIGIESRAVRSSQKGSRHFSLFLDLSSWIQAQTHLVPVPRFGSIAPRSPGATCTFDPSIYKHLAFCPRK